MTSTPVSATLRRALSHRCGYQLELRVANLGTQPVISWQAALAFGLGTDVTATETSTVLPGREEGVFIVAPVRHGTIAPGADQAVLVDVRCTTSLPKAASFTATTRDGALLNVPISDAAAGSEIARCPAREPAPGGGPAAQPPLLGYRTLAPAEVDRINEVKRVEQQVGALYRAVVAAPGTDPRWAQIARDHLETAFMALTRSLARPHSPFDTPAPQPSSPVEAGPAAAR